MTTSERSSSPRFRMGRRSLLFGGLGGASAVALGTVGQGSAVAAGRSQQPPQIEFDFDTDNYLTFLGPGDEDAGVSRNADIFGPMDVTTFLWLNHLTSIAAFDSVAPYHESAVGIYSRIGRRPSSESATNRNKNIAGLHAGWQVWQSVLGKRAEDIRLVLIAIGLDPDDQSEDPTSPVGIGNIAGKSVWEALKRDGMNFLGDEGGRHYNPRPWADYTGYQPVNTPFELTNPSRWQPQLHPHNGRRVGGGPGDTGIYVTQHMVTPQIRRVKPHIFDDPRAFDLAPPEFSNHHDRRAYKRSVDEILEASAGLTDEQKAIAEVMDNKVWGIGHSGVAIANKHDQNGELGIEGWAFWLLEHVLATFDPLIVAWHNKVKYDAVRPISAVRHVYGSRKVTAWGGPGMGTVDDIRADHWASYLPVGDHSEYPSGSTTLCAASAQAARRFFDSDVLDWRFTIPAGSTLTEPGITPANDLELYFPTWTDFNQKCANSRVWGGVHFRKTVERSLVLGEQFGDMAHDFVQRHINGEVSD
ncbi:DUF6851 domain-containing protein [Streptomyces sp. SBT349]|uniref:DUF6851 domain-containing protein n=1 Tax=Streptomyces sp. SBT349 TaxID=1580539 RepID=UPI00066E690B|nr:hypothetical protein [Streptomyces sp. SBT349]